MPVCFEPRRLTFIDFLASFTGREPSLPVAIEDFEYRGAKEGIFCRETCTFVASTMPRRIKRRLFIFNAYFRFRHASVTDGAVVAESGGSIHGSSIFVLGEAAQYRTQGRRRLLRKRKNKRRGIGSLRIRWPGSDLSFDRILSRPASPDRRRTGIAPRAPRKLQPSVCPVMSFFRE